MTVKKTLGKKIEEALEKKSKLVISDIPIKATERMYEQMKEAQAKKNKHGKKK